MRFDDCAFFTVSFGMDFNRAKTYLFSTYETTF